jgi:hypothetical protein
MPRTPHTAATSLLWLALCLAGTGCGKFREVSACRGVARQVNGAIDEIEALSKKTPVDELGIAKRYAALATALQPRAVGDKPLASAVRDYSAILRATDVTLRAHVEAVKVQYGRVYEPRRELERLVKREHAAVLRIDAECHN